MNQEFVHHMYHVYGIYSRANECFTFPTQRSWRRERVILGSTGHKDVELGV